MDAGVVEMKRPFCGIRLTLPVALALREAIRPLFLVPGGEEPFAIRFCHALYLSIYQLESDPEVTEIEFPLLLSDVLLLNQYISSEDGDWAKDLLHQTRQALYELHTGKEAVRLASQAEVEALLIKKPSGLELIPEEKGNDSLPVDSI